MKEFCIGLYSFTEMKNINLKFIITLHPFFFLKFNLKVIV